MGVLTGTLIVLGIGAAIGIGGGIWHACTEDDRARERIAQLQKENEYLRSVKEYVSNLKTKLTSANDYLKDGRDDFKNGGHVLDGVPLADQKFSDCITKMSGAIKNAQELIDDFNATISYNNSEIRKEQAKLD